MSVVRVVVRWVRVRVLVSVGEGGGEASERGEGGGEMGERGEGVGGVVRVASIAISPMYGRTS